MTEREQIVRKIVEEKGESAIPILVDFLFGGDPQAADISVEALGQLDCCKQLIERIDTEMKKDEISAGIYYIADLLGDKRCARSEIYLKKMLNLVKDEREALIIHGALLKIGFKDSEKYLLYELENNQEDFLDIAIALSYSDSEEVFKAILTKSEDHPESEEVIQSMCERNPDFVPLLQKNLRKSDR